MYERNKYILRQNMTMVITTNVKLNHNGHIIIEDHVDIPYREDTLLGGAFPSTGGIQRSLSTATITSVAMFLSIAILSIASIFPR